MIADRLDRYFLCDHKTRWRHIYVTIAVGAIAGMVCDCRGLSLNASCIVMAIAIVVSWAALIVRYVRREK